MTAVTVIGIKGNSDFDSVVKYFTSKGGDVILLNPERVCGKLHVMSSVIHAERAFSRGNNRSKTILTETMLYLAGERQIHRALAKMKPDSDRMVAVLFDSDVPDDLFSAGMRRDDSLYEITETKLKGMGIECEPEHFEDAILEMVAGVDILKN